ncbi:MAG: type II toxin-antitoxin system RelB/DinJ family antitoxin [Acidobacteria bacterium]|jgi:DNA-damage-inducible protein J|nr:type II toxin-antitoxin system RelB/DinJ family antitoxin [Acidobacteriota bacterium]
MIKTATIKAQMEPNLKREVEAIFKALGLSTTEAIQLFYQKVKTFKGLPFKDDTDTDTDVPNEETLQVMRDTDEGKNLTEWESVDSYFSYIKENVKTENHS